MSLRSKVVWSQGMFLQPHHFQQEARFVDHLVDARVRAAEPHAWGFSELVLDEGALALGRLGLTRASGVLPDGAPFSFPNLESTPAALDVPVSSQTSPSSRAWTFSLPRRRYSALTEVISSSPR